MTILIEEAPEERNPAWQLPAFMDQVRRTHLDLFVDLIRRAELSLNAIGDEPDIPYYDEAQIALPLRRLRLGLANYDPPVSGRPLREVRRATLLKLFDRCQELVHDLLRGWDEPTIEVEGLRRNLSLASDLVEMVCLMVERSDLATNPTEHVIDTLSWMIDDAAAICGDAAMREQDDDVSIGVRLANAGLEELAMPVVVRLSQVHALLERYLMTSPASLIRGV